MFAVVQGSSKNNKRSAYVEEILKRRNISGYVIGGFKGKNITSSDEISMIQTTIQSLPSSSARMMSLAGAPGEILHLVDCGVDLMQVDYPHSLVSLGLASTFSMDLTILQAYAIAKKTISSDAITSNSNDVHTDMKEEDNVSCNSASLSSTSTSTTSNASIPKHPFLNPFVIDLRDVKFKEDSYPILPGCTCYACSNYSRGYIHHLLNVKEMLGLVLLQLHNTHHYSEFFVNIRKHVHDNKFVDYKDSFMASYPDAMNSEVAMTTKTSHFSDC
jgi:queuine/archaeosine tRNA-ribosyltransferase